MAGEGDGGVHGVPRRLVERVTVADAETLRVKIRDVDMELEQKMT